MVSRKKDTYQIEPKTYVGIVYVWIGDECKIFKKLSD